MGSMNSFSLAGIYPIASLFFHMRFVIFRHFLGFLCYTCLLFHPYYVFTFQTPIINNLRNGLVFVLLIFSLVAGTVLWIWDEMKVGNSLMFQLFSSAYPEDFPVPHVFPERSCRKMGGSMARTAALNWPKGYFIQRSCPV